MLKLNLQYFGHLMRRVDSLEKNLMLGKIEGRRRRGQQRVRCLDGITNSMDMSLSTGRWWRTGKLGVLQSMGLQSQTWPSNWTTTDFIQAQSFPFCNFASLTSHSYCFFKKTLSENHVQLNLSHIFKVESENWYWDYPRQLTLWDSKLDYPPVSW